MLDAEQRLVGIIAREDVMRALTESARISRGCSRLARI
ncbi:hypothetical protein [Bradyrhizobium sp. AZCC 1610]